MCVCAHTTINEMNQLPSSLVTFKSPKKLVMLLVFRETLEPFAYWMVSVGQDCAKSFSNNTLFTTHSNTVKKKKSLSSFLKWAKWSTQDVKKSVHTGSTRQDQDLNSDLQMLKCVIFWRYGATCPLPSPWFLLLRGGKWESLQLPGLNHGLRCPTEHQVQVTWPLWVDMWRLKKEDGEKAWEMPSRDRQMLRSKMWALTSDDSLHLPKGYSSCLLKKWW